MAMIHKKRPTVSVLVLIGGVTTFFLLGWLNLNARIKDIEARLTQTATAPKTQPVFRTSATTRNQDRPDCYWIEPSHFEARTCQVGYYVAGEKGEGLEFKSLQCCRLPK
jgi:hypothetical protein